MQKLREGPFENQANAKQFIPDDNVVALFAVENVFNAHRTRKLPAKNASPALTSLQLRG